MGVVWLAVTCLAAGAEFNISDHGAKGDGKTLETTSLQAAIDAATNAEAGTVVVPKGMFLIGTVRLASNVTLHLDEGAVLRGSRDLDDYGTPETGKGRVRKRSTRGRGCSCGGTCP